MAPVLAPRVVVKDLAPLLRDMRAAGHLEARKELMAALREGGNVVRDQAKANAIALGLVGTTGRLVAELKTSATARAVVVKDTATNPKDGYHYPSRFEFEGRGSEALGRRAFLYPALEEKTNDAIRVISEGVGKALAKHHL